MFDSRIALNCLPPKYASVFQGIGYSGNAPIRAIPLILKTLKHVTKRSDIKGVKTCDTCGTTDKKTVHIIVKKTMSL